MLLIISTKLIPLNFVLQEKERKLNTPLAVLAHFQPLSLHTASRERVALKLNLVPKPCERGWLKLCIEFGFHLDMLVF